MPELVDDYFQPGWRIRQVGCAACEWRGDSRDMTLQPHEELSEYLCPRCEDEFFPQHPCLLGLASPHCKHCMLPKD